MLDVESRAAANCAAAYREWARRTGNPTATWPDLSASDLGMGRAGPPDSACLLAPIGPDSALEDAVDRIEAFFAERPGGPIQVWSLWPTPDLTHRGYVLYRVPGMIREAGLPAPAPPPGLEVVTARRPEDFVAASLLVDEAFTCAARDPEHLMSAALVDEDFEVFVGRFEGRVVATATSVVTDDLCGVYAVATDPSARGRGFGTAVTWAATTFRPDLIASLQASPLGYPVYRAMGYRDLGEFWLWQGPRPQAGGRRSRLSRTYP